MELIRLYITSSNSNVEDREEDEPTFAINDVAEGGPDTRIESGSSLI